MSTKKYMFKCRSPSGVFVISNLTEENTLANLKQVLFEKTQIEPDNLEIFYDQPPIKLELEFDELPLQAIFVEPKLMLTVNKKSTSKNESRSRSRSRSPITRDTDQAALFGLNAKRRDVPRPIPVYNANTGSLHRKEVPSNNSCLFTSVHFCMTDGQFDPLIGKSMRKIIADAVRSDPSFYNEAFLGKANSEYISWILDDDHWGGAIELYILSQHHSIEIVAIDTQNERLNRFGEDKNYEKRILLIYDGIHYDALYFKFNNYQDSPNLENVTTKFPCSAHGVLDMAIDIAKKARANRQYTDVHNFTIRCRQCEQGLKGQAQAVEHAKQTGHTQFGEF